MYNPKHIRISCITLLATISIAAGVVAHMICHKLNPATDTYLYIDSDDDIDSVCHKINQIQADVSLTAFRWLSTYTHYNRHIHAGRYHVSNQQNTLDLFRNLRSHNSSPISLVVPSVRSVEMLVARVSQQLMIDSTTLSDYCNNPDTWARLGYTHATFSALFIPDTYEVYWETTAESFIDRMKQVNRQFWNKSRMNKAQQIGLTHEEVITLASIVDSETANNAEKPRIAGLYINRLKLGMPLQSDPTVIYAVGDYSIRRVLNTHLQTPSPYNTYLHCGLPPGPIRIPTIAGIDAVLNYEHHSYLYMCAKEDFSGTHNFATTYAQHLVNARKYTKALTDNIKYHKQHHATP